MNRIVDLFPAAQQSTCPDPTEHGSRSDSFARLCIPRAEWVRALHWRLEILIANSAIRNLIRENKIHQIYGMMQTGQKKHGMMTFNQSLAQPGRDQADSAQGRSQPVVESRRVARADSTRCPHDHIPATSLTARACRARAKLYPVAKPDSCPDTCFAEDTFEPMKVLQGERFSSSPQALAAVLRREQVVPISIREKRSKKFRLRFHATDLHRLSSPSLRGSSR